MKKSRKLKLSTIIAAGANCVQVKLFRELFGESVMVTEELVASVAEKFDWIWAANDLLSLAARDRFYVDAIPARDRFYVYTASARKRFDSDAAAAWKRLDVNTAESRKRYHADTAPARKRYDVDTAVAWKRLDAAIATIWAREYINDGGTDKGLE